MAVLGVIGDYREQVNSVQITGREGKKKDLAIVRTGVLYSKKKNEKYPPDVWVNSGFLHSRLFFFFFPHQPHPFFFSTTLIYEAASGHTGPTAATLIDEYVLEVAKWIAPPAL